MATSARGRPDGQLKLGHTAVKSGPLCVTSSKLVSQKMVLDNMLAHYNKVSTAKSAIDNRPPESMLRSTKVRDRMRREALLKSTSTPRSRSAATARQASQRDQTAAIDTTDYLATQGNGNSKFGTSTEQRISSTGVTNGNGTATNFGYSESARVNGTQSGQATGTYFAQPVEVDLSPSATSSARKGYTAPQSADILDKRPQAFKPGGEFTPRTLNKDNSKSWLAKSKFYTPPKKRQTRQENGALDTTQNQYETEAYNAQYEAEAIPPLNISVDDDKMRWLREQAQLARSRKDVTESYDAKLDDPVRRSSNSPLRQSQSYDNTDALRRSVEAGGSGYKTFTGSSRQSKTMAMLSKEEEELRYLEFVSDVTNDIVSRGVYTNAALNQIFEYHMQKRKDVLKISRMRSMLDGLRDDLGIPLTDDDVVENYGYASATPDKSYLPQKRTMRVQQQAAIDTETDLGASTDMETTNVTLTTDSKPPTGYAFDSSGSPASSKPQAARKFESPARRSQQLESPAKVEAVGRPNFESTRADATSSEKYSEFSLGHSFGNDSTLLSTQQSQQSEVGVFTMTLSPSHLQTLMTTNKAPAGLVEQNKFNSTLNSSKDSSVLGTPQRRSSVTRDMEDIAKAYEKTLTMKLQEDETDTVLKPVSTTSDGLASPAKAAAPKSVTFAEKPDFLGTSSLMESVDFTRVSELGGTSQSIPESTLRDEGEDGNDEQLGATGFGANHFGNPGMTGKMSMPAFTAGNPGMTGKAIQLADSLGSLPDGSPKIEEDENTYAEDFDEES